MITYEKIDGDVIKKTITETIPEKVDVKEETYSYKWLVDKKKSLQDSIESHTNGCNEQIAEIEKLITECEKQGITAETSEEVVNPVEPPSIDA